MMMWYIALMCLMNVISDQNLTVGTDTPHDGDTNLSAANGNGPPDTEDANYITQNGITDINVENKYDTRTQDYASSSSYNDIMSEPTIASLTSLIKYDQVATSYEPSTPPTDNDESSAITYPMTQTAANVDDKITTGYTLKSKQTKTVEYSKANTTPPTHFAPTTPISVDVCDTDQLEITKNTPVQVIALTRNTNCNLLVTAPNSAAIAIRLIDSGLNDVSTYFYTENVGTQPQNCTNRYVLVSVKHTPCTTIIGGSQFRLYFQNSNMLVEVQTMDVQISKCFDSNSSAMGQVQCELKSYAKQIQIERSCWDCMCDYQCTCTLGYREWVSTCIDGNGIYITSTNLIVYKPSMIWLSFSNTGMHAIQPGVFDALGNLLYLDLSDNNIAALPSGVFDWLGYLWELHLSDNNIAAIPTGVFDALGNLLELDLSDNNIAALPAGVFDILGNLNYLFLSGNNIAVLPAGVIGALGNLWVLDLSDNNIAALPAGVFDTLSNLRALSLGDNNIAALPIGIFDSLGDLEYLYLSDNNITALPIGIFDSLGDLEYLKLNDNNIAALPVGIFDSLGDLEYLKLSDNNIAAIAIGVFDSLGYLLKFDLSNNFITVLPVAVFDSLGVVTHLYLSHNAIAFLPVEVFRFLGRLKYLDLSDNNIATITVGLFDSLGELGYLDLSDNNIAVVPAGVFDSLRMLVYLYLCDNNITVIPAGVFESLGKLWYFDLNDTNRATSSVKMGYLDLSDNDIATLPVGVFDPLNDLTDLDLSNNKIAALPDVFDVLGTLLRLDLSDNNIELLPAHVFDSLRWLIYLYLSDNNIAALPADVFDLLGNLRKLDLYGNNISSLHEYVFKSLSELQTLNISYNHVLHNLPGDVFKSLGRLQILVLSNNAIEILPDVLFSAQQNLLVLDLSSNALSTLPVTGFFTLKKLILLNLCCNNLTIDALQGFTSLTTLQVLDLSKNNIKQLPTDSLSSTTNLLSLDISENYLKVIHAHCFANMRRLVYLNMSKNSLFSLPLFSAQEKLEVLDLSENSFNSLAPVNFLKLQKLTFLSLCKNNLVALPDYLFHHMNYLTFVNVSYNAIQKIGPNIFSNESKLQTFDMRENAMYKVTHDSFKTNPQNATVIVDKFATCCFMDEAQCISIHPSPEYLTCKRMLQDVFLRISVWVLGFSALICNGIAYYVRSHKRERNKVQTLLTSNKVQTLFISHLALADLLMGVNMLILAFADVYYGEYFPSYVQEWRQGFACKVAGFLAIFSSEGSVLFIALISIDRLLGIKYPFGGPLSTKWARFCVALAWLVAFLLSVIPIALATDTGDVFSISEVCIGIPIVQRHLTTVRKTSVEINATFLATTLVTKSKTYRTYPNVWYFPSLTGVNMKVQQQPQNITYFVTDIIGSQIASIFSIVVFIGVNLSCFIIVAFCYVYIFIKAGKTSDGSGRTLDRDEQIRMAKKMFAIVYTDFCCWVPLSFICILVQCGVITVSPEMYAWTVGFILPINSSINPFLYVLYETISNHLKKKEEERKARKNIEMKVRWKPLVQFGLEFDQNK